MKFYAFEECVRENYVCGWLKGDKFKENARYIGWGYRIIKIKSKNRIY